MDGDALLERHLFDRALPDLAASARGTVRLCIDRTNRISGPDEHSQGRDREVRGAGKDDAVHESAVQQHDRWS